MKKHKNIILRLFAAILSIIMVLSVIACTAPQQDGNDPISSGTDVGEKIPEPKPVETMKVAVFTLKAVKGNLLNKQRVELADVPVTDLPIDPITNLEDVIGKYLICDVDKGSCVSASMLSTMDPLVSANGLGAGFVLITDVINSNPDIRDMSTLIQKAIDENPNKTIYFPDGTYSLSKTVTIPSDPEKSVSFRLSNYAMFVPANDWNSTESTALVRYGSESSPKTTAGDHSDYFMGGILDAKGKGTAFEINGGGRLFVNNVSIKNSRIGIHVKPNAAYNDIENVNVTAPNADGTKGIFVEGTNNTFMNMRIYRVLIGAHLTGGDNVLVNLHPLFSGTNSIKCIGFYDQSPGNRYSMCYSDQFSVGFKLGPQTKSYFDSCFMYWWKACSYQIGFLCEGDFNSVIADTVVSMAKVNNSGAGTESHYIFFIDESTGDPVQPNPGQNDEEEEEEEEEEETTRPSRPSRPGSGGSSSSSSGSSSQTVQKLKERTPAGNGVIINPIIPSSRYSDSNTYTQFMDTVK